MGTTKKTFLLVAIIALILGFVFGNSNPGRNFSASVFSPSVDRPELCTWIHDSLRDKARCNGVKETSTNDKCEILDNNVVALKNSVQRFADCVITFTDNSTTTTVRLYRKYKIQGTGGNFLALNNFPEFNTIVAGGTNNGYAVVYTENKKYTYFPAEEKWTETSGLFNNKTPLPVETFPPCNEFNKNICLNPEDTSGDTAKNSLDSIKAYWKASNNNEYFLTKSDKHYLYKISNNAWSPEFFKVNDLPEQNITFSVTYDLSTIYTSAQANNFFIPQVLADHLGLPPLFRIEFGNLDIELEKVAVSWKSELYQGVHSFVKKDGNKYEVEISFSQDDWNEISSLSPSPNLWRLVLDKNADGETDIIESEWFSLGNRTVEVENVSDERLTVKLDSSVGSLLYGFNDIYQEASMIEIGAMLKNKALTFAEDENVKGVFTVFDKVFFVTNQDIYYFLDITATNSVLIEPQCQGARIFIYNTNQALADNFYPGFMGNVYYEHFTDSVNSQIEWESSLDNILTNVYNDKLWRSLSIPALSDLPENLQKITITVKEKFDANSPSVDCTVTKNFYLSEGMTAGEENIDVYSQ